MIKLREIDAAIGMNIRAHRRRAGLLQHELGQEIEVSSQQVQKYENGMNRVSASRLFMISQALRVSLYAFFRR